MAEEMDENELPERLEEMKETIDALYKYKIYKDSLD